ncbi:MAG: hypothetical protein MK212_22570, partial [Saprospiraceae bacterium]|nr:hypothetical protein [Saprospiraceae bacterium]
LLELSGNNFPDFQEQILSMPRLSVIRYKANLTKNLPDKMLHTECMQLDLSENKIEVFPPKKFKFLRLTNLTLKDNNLQELGEHIDTVDTLRNPNLAENPIIDLPSSLYNLRNLGVLVLANTNITLLSEELGKLQGLFSLNLRGTQLRRLPEIISKLPLKRLDISNTPMIADKAYIKYLKQKLPKTKLIC